METPYLTCVSNEEYKVNIIYFIKHSLDQSIIFFLFQYVYEPAEDTFLMLDALENELNFIEELNPLICAEIGSGSGINITALSKKLAKSKCFAIDINSIACKVFIELLKFI